MNEYMTRLVNAYCILVGRPVIKQDNNKSGSLENVIESNSKSENGYSNKYYTPAIEFSKYVVIKGDETEKEVLKYSALSNEARFEIDKKNASIHGDCLTIADVVAKRDASGELYSFEDKMYIPSGWTEQVIIKKFKRHN